MFQNGLYTVTEVKRISYEDEDGICYHNAYDTNLASNFSALIAYLLAGSVNFKIAIPCTICSITGCLLGSHFAIKKGTKFIKIIIIIASMLLLLKIIIDMIK